MYPLLLCSIIALALMIERSFFYSKMKKKLHDWFEELILLKEDRQIQSKLSEIKNHVVHDVLSILWKSKDDKANLEAIAQEEAEEELQKLQKNLKPLGVIATLSPLIGLLGTVLGIMKAFLETSASGKIDPALLAGGIWEALITTFVGLGVAIPVWIAYYIFESRVERLTFMMEYYSSRFIRFIQNQ